MDNTEKPQLHVIQGGKSGEKQTDKKIIGEKPQLQVIPGGKNFQTELEKTPIAEKTAEEEKFWALYQVQKKIKELDNEKANQRGEECTLRIEGQDEQIYNFLKQKGIKAEGGIEKHYGGGMTDKHRFQYKGMEVEWNNQEFRLLITMYRSPKNAVEKRVIEEFGYEAGRYGEKREKTNTNDFFELFLKKFKYEHFILDGNPVETIKKIIDRIDSSTNFR